MHLVSVCKRVLVLVLALDWTQCLPQCAGGTPAMLRGRMTGFPQNTGCAVLWRGRIRWIQFAQSLLTVADQPRAGCIRLVQQLLFIPCTTFIRSTSAALDTIPELRVSPTCPALTTTTPHPSSTPALPSLSQHTHMQDKQ